MRHPGATRHRPAAPTLSRSRPTARAWQLVQAPTQHPHQHMDGEQEAQAAECEAERLYLQAINSCRGGDGGAGDALLRRLNCAWRLSDAVWRGAAAAAEQPAPAAAAEQPAPAPAAAAEQPGSTPGSSRVLVADAPLPQPLLAALQAAFDGATSDFWSSHAYDQPATPFFSYALELQDAAAKAAAAAGRGDDEPGPAPCVNALELAALLLQGQLPAARGATHVEWWAHTRPAWAPHQLHFDAAEAAFRAGLGSYRLVHPTLSSVVYLTAAGGPTLVLEQDTSGATEQQQAGGELPAAKRARHDGQAQHVPPQLAASAAVIHPAVGRVAVWPGNLLHGVLPGAAMPLEAADADAAGADDGSAAAAAGDDGGDAPAAAQRTTLIVAWWQAHPQQLVGVTQEQQQAGRQQLGPCMDMPVLLTGGAAAPRWLQALQLPRQQLADVLQQLQRGCGVELQQQQSGAAILPQWRLLPSITPAWQAVPRPADMCAEPTRSAAQLPGLRFCLRSAGEVALSPDAAAKTPWAGVLGAYQHARDPWQRPDLAAFRREFYGKLLQWLSAPPASRTHQVSEVFVWSMASWDVFGVYRESTSAEGSFRGQPGLLESIAQHDLRVRAAAVCAGRGGPSVSPGGACEAFMNSTASCLAASGRCLDL